MPLHRKFDYREHPSSKPMPFIMRLAVKPSKGDALLFFSLHLNGTTDEMSLHGSCPVIEREKWSATKWIHVRSYGRKMTEYMDCTDEDVDCAQWACKGECQKNPP